MHPPRCRVARCSFPSKSTADTFPFVSATMIRSLTIRGDDSVALATSLQFQRTFPSSSRERRQAFSRGEVDRLASFGGGFEDPLTIGELPEDRTIRQLDGIESPSCIADVDHAVGEQGLTGKARERRRPLHHGVLREVAPRDRSRPLWSAAREEHRRGFGNRSVGLRWLGRRTRPSGFRVVGSQQPSLRGKSTRTRWPSLPSGLPRTRGPTGS